MKKVKILSIDSGGIKGLIPSVILNYIEEQLQKKTNNPNATLSDFFDMIAGTSTGGILACFYLLPSGKEDGPKAKFFAKEAISLYSEKAKEIFKPKLSKNFKKLNERILSTINTANNLLSEEYSEEGLESILEDTMGDIKLSETLKHCFVISYDISTCRPVLFSTPEAKKYIHRDYYLRYVSRATSAAPTYFKLATIQSMAGATRYMIDGAIFASNPTMCAIVEANKYFFQQTKNYFIDDMFVLSIGTGKERDEYDYKKAQNWGIAHWAIPVLNIMQTASAEIVDYHAKKMFASANNSENYFRIEPDLCNANFEMDDVSDENLKNLKDAALNYIAQHAEAMDVLVDKIIKENN